MLYFYLTGIGFTLLTIIPMNNLKVLFVCGGNNASGRSPNVDVQAEGLKKAGVDIPFFEIKGKGLQGYLKSVPLLKDILRKDHFDVVHAHYGLSGIVASLAGAKPLVVTIMGSELHLSSLFLFTMKFFSKFVWKKVIVQSNRMKSILGDNAIVLPNGVDIDRFKNINPDEARKVTGFKTGKHIIWVSDPGRKEKNFALAKKAVDLLNRQVVSLDVVNGIPHEKIPFYFKAADVLLLTSRWEGSPIVVKEAIASGLPVVSTDVGDVKELVSGTDGCYVTKDSALELSEALKKALEFPGRTDGLKNIAHLDLSSVSEKLRDVYLSMIIQ